jgi:FkbM family methyltransferase
VIDIGCSNAFISCYLAKQVGPTGRVVALEPDPIAFGMAMDNIVLNSLSNVSLLPKGIHHTSGTQQMVIASTGSSYIGSQATEGTVPVEVLSLESLIEQARIDVSRLRLVKLDIEGGEVAIAHDLVQLVKRSPAVMIAAASYHKVNGRESCAILEDCVCQERQLCVRTLYPYHTTTFIAHRDNPVSKSLEAARGLVNHSV